MAISDQTTNFSNVSIEGRLSANTIQATGTFIGSILSSTGTVQGTLGVFSDVSSTNTVRGAIAVASDVSSTNTVRASRLLIGSATAGTALTRIAKGTISVVDMTCTGNGSTTTTATVAGLTTSDVLVVNPPSSLSSGVVLTAYASGNSAAVLIFSNCSTATQVVAAMTVSYVAIRSA